MTIASHLSRNEIARNHCGSGRLSCCVVREAPYELRLNIVSS